jgi:hypothetical protein
MDRLYIAIIIVIILIFAYIIHRYSRRKAAQKEDAEAYLRKLVEEINELQQPTTVI